MKFKVGDKYISEAGYTGTIVKITKEFYITQWDHHVDKYECWHYYTDAETAWRIIDISILGEIGTDE